MNKFNLLYSLWIKKNFKKASSVSIRYPIYLKGPGYITIGNNFDCDQRLRLDAIDEFLGEKFSPEIIIGNNVSIQKDCHIGAINRIVIGNNVLLASKVFITDHSHGKATKEDIFFHPSQRKLFCKGSVIIEDNVWLGEGVVVLSGVTIGENSIVGANAVVTKSIPKNSIVGGNPTRIIREVS
jgi:acetyltransferase-like isoleucine patch superfamily enzyme